MAEIVVVCGNVFTAFQDAVATRPDNLKVEMPSSVLTIFQNVSYVQNPRHLSAGNQLYIFDQAQPSSYSYSVGNTIQFTQQVLRTKYGVAINYISFAQNTRTVKHEIVGSFLPITQQLLVSRGVYNTLTLSQALTVLKSKKLIVNQTLPLVQAVSVYKYNNPDFVAIDADSGTQDFTPLTLISGSTTLVLCIPEFGDKDSVEHTRINRENRGGERIIFRDPVWPITEKLSFKLINLSQFQVKQTLDFIDQTLGMNVTLIDHYGVSWTGIIINPDANAEQNTTVNGDYCPAFTMEIDFQGEMV